MPLVRYLCASLLALLLAPIAIADIVKLADGRTFEGRIVEQTRYEVTIDTLVANIRTTMTFDRSEIAEIVDRDLPDDFFEPKRRRSDDPDDATAASGDRDRDERATERTRYVLVPLEGTFGEEIQPEGVAEALANAKRARVEHIVFQMKSGGGYVWAASEIAELLAEHDDEFTYIALIDEAISATIWVALSCDHIVMRPGSTIGGAVVFTQNVDTGAAEVDAKMISITSAQLAALGEKKGHPGAVTRAMVDQDAELHVWHDAAGERRIADKAPSGVRVETIDDAQSVLTLTQQSAVQLGFAKPFEGEASELGALFGHEGWHERGRIGEAAMLRARKVFERERVEVDELVREFRRKWRDLQSSIDRAAATHPSDGTYEVHRGGRTLTHRGRQMWRSACDRAIVVWQECFDDLQKVYQLDKKLRRFRVESGVDLEELEDTGRRVDDELRWLRQHRNTSVLP